MDVYLFPGQGSDYRLFKRISFPENYKVHYITLPTPDRRGMSIHEYALQVSCQIDSVSVNTVFIGVSLGGMVCCELNNVFEIEKTIVISSAKSRQELPMRYRFQKYIPLYQIFPKKLLKWGSYMAQPIFEPDRKRDKELCDSMLRSKDPLYLKRTIGIIVRWDAETYNEKIKHIHGDNDHTLPISKVKYDYLIENGSHMMALTKGEEMNKLIGQILGY